jgi:orotate phosphoribosyltransferase
VSNNANSRKYELIKINSYFFFENDDFSYLGKVTQTSGEKIKIYFNEHSFGNHRKTYRLILFTNKNSVFPI